MTKVAKIVFALSFVFCAHSLSIHHQSYNQDLVALEQAQASANQAPQTTYGPKGGVCPQGTYAIEDLDTCKAAITHLAGQSGSISTAQNGFTESVSDDCGWTHAPNGCSYRWKNGAQALLYFNKGKNGNQWGEVYPICSTEAPVTTVLSAAVQAQLAKYSHGPKGGECPDGTQAILDLNSCKEAVAVLANHGDPCSDVATAKNWDGGATESDGNGWTHAPNGCSYRWKNGAQAIVYFNHGSNGNAWGEVYPICSQPPHDDVGGRGQRKEGQRKVRKEQKADRVAAKASRAVKKSQQKAEHTSRQARKAERASGKAAGPVK